MVFFLKNVIHNSANIGIGIGSVSADLKKSISVIYRIGRFKKWNLSVYIGIGRYEKKLIGRTLVHTVSCSESPVKLSNNCSSKNIIIFIH